MKKTIVYSVLLGLLCGLPALAAPVRYVAQNGGRDSNNGLSWATPFATIQKGIDSLVAQEGGTGTVYVEAGYYAPVTSANHPIRIEAVREVLTYSTIITGENVTRCATLGNPSLVDMQNPSNSVPQNATVLSGFVLAFGRGVQGAHPASAFGAGVFGGTLTNCLITQCTTGSSGGGAAFSTLIDCAVNENVANANGGGLFHCTFVGGSMWGNQAGANGGGVAESDIRNVTIGGSIAAGYGGGAYNSKLANCMVYYNQSKTGGGVSKSTIYNCTLMSNHIAKDGVSDVIPDTNSAGADDSVCYNSLFIWNYYVENGLYTSSNGDLRSTFYSCCIPVLPLKGTGNITESPNLQGNGDAPYRLLPGSPCINAGNKAYVPAGVLTDIDGNARIAHGTVDIGCHEFSDDISVWVALDARGGSVTPGDLEVVYGGKYDGLADATRRGYVFNGWTLDGVPVTADSYVTRMPQHTLVAQWTPVTVTVHVDLGGAGDTTVYLPFGGVYMHTIPAPVKTGHTFAGWLDVGNDQVFQVTTVNAHTVHPAWTAKTVAVQADLDGDGVADTTVHLPFGSAYAAGIAESARDGHDFAGWMDGTGATVTTVSNESAHTVYSKWRAAGAPAQFDEDGDIAIPVITGISMDTMKQSVTITVSNCVQSASVYWLEGTDDLTTKFLPLEPTDYETPAAEIRDGIWIIPDIPVNTGLGQFFYKVGVGSRE